MGMDWVIWLLVMLIFYAMAWLSWRIIRPKPAKTAPPPARTVKPAPPAAVVSAPGYLPRWDGTRKWSVREEKKAWDSAFHSAEKEPAGPGVYRK